MIVKQLVPAIAFDEILIRDQVATVQGSHVLGTVHDTGRSGKFHRWVVQDLER